MSSGKTVINMSIIGWCCVVIIELFIIAYLINSGFILLLSAVLIPPVWAAFTWPAPEVKQVENNDSQPKEIATEKAE